MALTSRISVSDAMIALNALFAGVTYFGMGWTQLSPSNNITSKP